MAGAVSFLASLAVAAVAFVVSLAGAAITGAVAFLLSRDVAVAFVVPLAGWGRGSFVSISGVVALRVAVPLCAPSAGAMVCCVLLALGGRGASCAGGQALMVAFPQRVAKS